MARVRQAGEDDIPRVLELYRQLALDPDTEVANLSPADCQRIFTEMSTTPGYELLVAEEAGEIVATTVLVILPGLSHNASPFAVIDYVVVDEAHRRQGIGKLLMDYCLDRSREAGFYKVMLTSDNQREAAYRFYRALGFEDSSHGFWFYF